MGKETLVEAVHCASREHLLRCCRPVGGKSACETLPESGDSSQEGAKRLQVWVHPKRERERDHSPAEGNGPRLPHAC
ncbi:hypothetical protein cyc_08649 [Cyclospora cayetanensis]|uniref:Uncharacterized protein n=1 Tax=Cyclospora cayetanensis TaxID=88456 RepID=A0A1D3D8I6_9EIME|nr:hypothetical protein cyc_08649 [Cyclospora cayetanensis]